jgi:EmrB/QacA subfamily drug resistance transporter
LADKAVTVPSPATVAARAGEASSAAEAYKWKAFWVIALAFVTMVMDFSVTGVALPTIAREFNLTLRVVSWVAIAGSLTITAVLLPFGRLADIAGRKRVHITGIALFTTGALLAALAPNLPALIGGRVIMALGAAMIQAVGMAMVTSVFPSHERGKAIGMITTVVGIGAIAGPILGGPLVEAFGWRSVYFFLAAPTIPAFVLALRVLDDARVGNVKRAAGEPYDWTGAATSALFLSLIIFTVTNPFDFAWASAPVIGGALAAAVLIAVFIRWELRARAPMISLRFFQDAQFSLAATARSLGFIGSAAAWFVMPFYVQDVLGYKPTVAGLVIFFGALGFAATGYFSGRWSDRYGPRRFVIGGLAIAMVANLAFTTLQVDSPVWLVVVLLLANGIGMGLWNAPNTSILLSRVERSSYGIIAAFTNLVRNVFSTTGTAMVTAVVAGVMLSHGVAADLGAVGEAGDPRAASAFVSGMRVAFFVQAAVLLAALAAAVATRDKAAVKSTSAAVAGHTPQPAAKQV